MSESKTFPNVKIIRLMFLVGIFFGVTLAARAGTLYNFGGYDGDTPNSLVQAADGNFYGATSFGGNIGDGEYIQVGNDSSLKSGTLFRMTPAGAVTVLHRFAPVDSSEINSDGAVPNPLVLGKDGNLYGTTFVGGANGQGVFFKLSTSGQFTVIASLTEYPQGYLAQNSDGTFYGLSGGYGSTFGSGTLFGITPSGQQTLSYTFPYPNFLGSSSPVIGPDGAIYGMASYLTASFNTVTFLYRFVVGGQFTEIYDFSGGYYSDLTVGRDGNLYGTTTSGGASNTGQVFRATTTGTVTYLGDFGPADVDYYGDAPLLQASDGSFYGTRDGGADNDGVLFRVTPGSDITDLHLFTGGADGICSETHLIQASDGNLYGAGAYGGIAGGGTLFRASLAGSLTTLYSFPFASDANALIQATDGNLYGTTLSGGEGDNGTLYRLSLSGDLTPLYSFPPISYSTFDGPNTTGGFPSALVQAANGLLYGTCRNGGANGTGTAFHSTTEGSVMAVFSFPPVPIGNPDGAQPGVPLVQGRDGSLYGATVLGGVNDDGTVFRIKPDGSFQTLHSFTEGSNLDAVGQIAVAEDGTLYGVLLQGGDYEQGSIYKITPAGAYQTIHSFTGADGALPEALVIGADGALYGCASDSGLNGSGNVFKCDSNGAFSVLYSFSALSNVYTGTNSDGAYPFGLLQTADGSLIVSAEAGGSAGNGTLLQLAPNLTATVLHTFGTGDGAGPNAVVSDGNGGYFGSCADGGANGTGMIFHLAADGSYSDLHDFKPLNRNYSNAGGAYPTGLVRIGQTYYGLTSGGGPVQRTPNVDYAAQGVLFQISAQGRFKVLHNLQNAEGTNPSAALLAGADGALYGCGTVGGPSDANPSNPVGSGTIFRATTQGVLTVLHDFSIFGVNAGGSQPYAPLIQATDGNFYGTTFAGGDQADGVVFKLTPSGTETVLHNFGDVPEDGLLPVTALLQAADGSFYGTTTLGGANGDGVVFKITSQGVYSIVYSLDSTGYPANALVQDADGALYGTTEYGGEDYFGTTFRLGADGTFDILHDFTGQDDGGNPLAPLTLIPVASLPGPLSQIGSPPVRSHVARIRPLGMTGGVYHKIGDCMTGGVYGKANAEPSSPALRTRSVNAKGPMSVLTRIREARSLPAPSPQARSLRTKKPASDLASQDDAPPVGGTVFEQNLDGSVSPLVSFNGKNGANPQAAIIPASDGYYYGTTPNAGPSGGGTAFRLTLPIIDAVGPANPPLTKLTTLQVAGSGFAAGSQIAVNGKPVATQRASTSLLTASVTLIAYVAPPATSVTITVIAPDGTVSNAYSLPITP